MGLKLGSHKDEFINCIDKIVNGKTDNIEIVFPVLFHDTKVYNEIKESLQPNVVLIDDFKPVEGKTSNDILSEYNKMMYKGNNYSFSIYWKIL